VRHSGQQVSQYIILVGVLVVVATMFWTASNYLGAVQLPESKQQELVGPASEVAEQTGRLIDRCWESADHGRSDEYIDCYIVNVSIQGSGEITEDDLPPHTETTPAERISLSAPMTDDTSSIRITYQPSERSIIIS